MPPNQPDPQKPESKKEEVPPPQKGPIDLGKILLPKKEPPKSQERINAGALLEQEVHATLKPEKKTSEVPPPLAPIQPKKKDSSSLQSLQTYKGDIEQLVESKKISVVNIAAAEAAKRAAVEALPAEKISHTNSKWLQNILMIMLGVILLATAGGGLMYAFFFQQPPTADITHNLQSPFIIVDSTEIVSLPPGTIARTEVMNALVAARNQVSLSLGLMARLYPATPAPIANVPPQLISIQTLLSIIVPAIPPELLRSIDPTYYTLGVYSFDENQMFLIVRVDSYAHAYSGMLAWERTMYNELQPLFSRTPRPRVIGEETATTTPPVQVLNTVFVDRLVENRDARVVQNEVGDILLLWTFLDRSTIAITTNEHTLLEIITRFTDISVVPQP